MVNLPEPQPFANLTVLSDVAPRRWSGTIKLPKKRHPTRFLILEQDNHYRAVQAHCPHDLSEVPLDADNCLLCPLHGQRVRVFGAESESLPVQRDGDSFLMLPAPPTPSTVQPPSPSSANRPDEQAELNLLRRELESARQARASQEQEMLQITAAMNVMLREVEEQRNALQEGHQQQQALNAFIQRVTDTMSSLLLVVDSQGIIQQTNQQTAKELGYSAPELVGQLVDTLLPPTERQHLHAQYPTSPTSGESALLNVILHVGDYSAEHHLLPATPSESWPIYLMNGAPLYNPQGKLDGAVLVASNITSHKQAEFALKAAHDELLTLHAEATEQQELFRAVADLATELVYYQDLSGQYIYVSPFCSILTGYSQAEFYQTPRLFRQLVHADDQPRWAQFRQERDDTVSFDKLEIRIIHRNGSLRWVEYNFAVVTDEQHQLIGYRATAVDVTQHKEDLESIRQLNEQLEQSVRVRERAQHALQTSETRFRKLIEHAPDGMVLVNQYSEIVLVNAQTEALFGYSRSELIGQTLSLLIPSRFHASHATHVAQYFKKPTLRLMGQGLELYGLHRDGHEIPLEVTLSPMHTSDGYWVISTLRDITERKAIEEARLAQETLRLEKAYLQAKTDELTKLNADKDRFFSIVAHDLRGPFHPLLGNTELFMNIVDTLSAEDITCIAEDIHQSATAIYTLLENLLTWSRMHMGRMPFEPTLFDLNPVVVDTHEVLENMAKTKGIRLVNAVPLDIQIYADKNMIETVIRNVISNALKFTSAQGQVIVQAEPHDDKQMLVSIIDTGVGISPKGLSKLFRFDQHHSTEGTAKESGSGLGLLICQEMITTNQGRIWAESEVGQGTTINFTVPSASTKSSTRSRCDWIG